MKKMFRRKRPPVGAHPGAFEVSETADAPRIRVFTYNNDSLSDHQNVELRQLFELVRSDQVTWIDVQGLGDEEAMQQIAENFSLHPLVMADVVNVPQRPKTEDHGDYFFIVSMMVRIAEVHDSLELNFEQVSFFVGKNWVISFQEKYGDVFDPVRNRIVQKKGVIRKSGSDYLAYSLLDTIVDGYYPILEQLGDSLEVLEDEVIDEPTKETSAKIFASKRKLLQLRHSLWPQRESISGLVKSESKLIKRATKVYMQDTYDHVIQAIDVVESYRELCGGFTDLYLSSLSNKMNEVMKVLTMISTIFIPLSFLAGVYGMNFQNMPELSSRFGYPILLAVMAAVALMMLYYFKRKGWFESDET